MKQPTRKELLERIEQLESECERLKFNHLGMLTRQGALVENERIEYKGRRHVVMLDINFLHQMNEAHGSQEAVDVLMRRAFSIRTGDLLFKFNFSSGDEYGFVIKGDPEKFMKRMETSLTKNGLSAMMAAMPFNEGDHLMDVCKQAIEKVYVLKKERNIESR